jgi:membrane-bound lytic murein transglycosylase D
MPLLLLGLALPVPTAPSTRARLALDVSTPIEMVHPVPLLPARLLPAMPQPRLPVIAWDLPVTRNDRVDFWIRWLSRHNHARTALWLERSGRYAPMTREKLRARGMPEDLIYLALIESGFSPSATSRAQAIGLWQFVAETGQRYGLKLTPYLDERYDPVKSTDAALRYLRELHARFGSWYLAAAAYNSGENKVARLLREHAGGARGDETLYWRISPYLPQETRDYVPLMLAAGYIGKEPGKYGFVNLDYQLPLRFQTVKIPGGVSLSTVARAIEVAADDVEELNPHLVLKMTPPGRVTEVRIPAGRALPVARAPARRERPRTLRADAAGSRSMRAAALAPARTRRPIHDTGRSSSR